MKKVLIAIISCLSDKQSGRNQSLRETWLQDTFWDRIFFYGKDVRAGTDEICLNVSDGEWDVVRKSRLAKIWALDKEYDFVFTVFPDTWVDISQLMKSRFDSSDFMSDSHAPAGTQRDGGWTHSHPCICGGDGYWTSKRACEVIRDADPEFLQNITQGRAEDLWTSEVLGAAGIVLTDNIEYGKGITVHGTGVAGSSAAYNPKWMYEQYKNRGA